MHAYFSSHFILLYIIDFFFKYEVYELGILLRMKCFLMTFKRVACQRLIPASIESHRNEIIFYRIISFECVLKCIRY